MKKRTTEEQRSLKRKRRQQRYEKKLAQKLVRFNLEHEEEASLYAFSKTLDNFSGTVKRLLKEESERLGWPGKTNLTKKRTPP